MSGDERLRLIETDTYKCPLTVKDKCKEMFFNDLAKSKNHNDILCASFDLEKVLNTPQSKYAYYNESIYESGTNNGYCFLWGETDGKRGSNEISAIMHKSLDRTDKAGKNQGIIIL